MVKYRVGTSSISSQQKTVLSLSSPLAVFVFPLVPCLVLNANVICDLVIVIEYEIRKSHYLGPALSGQNLALKVPTSMPNLVHINVSDKTLISIENKTITLHYKLYNISIFMFTF